MKVVLSTRLEKLYEITERLRKLVFEEEKAEELHGEILMSEETLKKDGKGFNI